MSREINQHDVGTPKDYAHQIILAFKNLEHGVSDFQGSKVMEASEEEMMYELIEEAITQASQKQIEMIEGEVRKDTLQELLMEYQENEFAGKGYNFYFSIRSKLDDILSILSQYK